jgi:predicted enzyme related to lactoylglutathione lyase
MSNQYDDKEIKERLKFQLLCILKSADDVERARKFYSTLFGWK